MYALNAYHNLYADKPFMPWNCYKTVSFSTSSVPQICKKKIKEYWICFFQLRMCDYRGNTYDPLKLFLTAKSRDRTADITASCIEGNITWWSIAEIAAFPDELPSLLVISAANEEYDKELKQWIKTCWFSLQKQPSFLARSEERGACWRACSPTCVNSISDLTTWRLIQNFRSLTDRLWQLLLIHIIWTW